MTAKPRGLPGTKAQGMPSTAQQGWSRSCLLSASLCAQVVAVLEMAAELGALTPKLAALPGTTAHSSISNLLNTMRNDDKLVFNASI